MPKGMTPWLTRPGSLILARHGKGLVELIKRIGELTGSQQFFTGTVVPVSTRLLVPVLTCGHIPMSIEMPP